MSMRTDQNFDDFEKKKFLRKLSPSNYGASFIGNSFFICSENLNHAVDFPLFSMKKRDFFWRITQLMQEKKKKC